MRRRRGIMGLNGGAGIPVITATTTGNPLSFVTDMVRPLKSLVIPFTPIQEGSGDPSPTNDRPISGWTGANIEHAHSDFYDSAGTTGYNANTNVTIISKNAIQVQGKSNSNYPASKQLLSVYPLVDGRKYCVSSDVLYTSGKGQITIRDASSNTVARSGSITSSGHYRLVFTYDSSTMNNLSFFCNYGASGGNVTYTNITFEDVTTLPVTFTDPTTGDPMTIYGGPLTLNEDGSADLVRTHRYALYDGDENWKWSTNSGRYNANIAATGIYRPSAKSLYAIPCNCAKGGSNSVTSYFAVGATWQDSRIYFFNPTTYLDGVTDLATFKAYIAEHPIQVVYPLATPQTYHFDNVGQLITFVGTNTIWTDTNGTNTATYLKHQS